MKKTKLTHKKWAKILAVILTVVTEIALALCIVGTAYCYEAGVYKWDTDQPDSFYESYACRNAVIELYWTLQWCYDQEGLENLIGVLKRDYAGDFTNASICIYDVGSGEILALASNPRTENRPVSEESRQEFVLSDTRRLSIAVAEPLVVEDVFSYHKQMFDFALQFRWLVLGVGAACVFMLLTLVIFLFCSVGHREGVEGIHLTLVDKIPLDLLAGGIIFFLALLFEAFFYGADEVVILLTVGQALAIWFFLSFAARCKAGNPFKNTIILRLWKFAGKVLRALGQALRSLYRMLPMIWKAVLILIALAFFEIMLIAGVVNGSGFWAFLFIAVNLALVAAVIFGVCQLAILKKAGKELASGNFDYKVNTGKMYWEFRQHGEHLNSIGLGMALAVEQRTRSERLKTELITNVSHDIKTPLTSIINYVDFLQRPGISAEEQADYLDVLSRQSRKLKKLTEDLVEASKASTGNLSVTLIPTSVRELLDQAVAEYGERLQAGRLEPVIHMSETDFTVMADGRLLWRVMDNLLNNVCKYALPGTRVYLDARQQDGQVVLSVKNVSRDPLNVSEEELMERFVRGDTSRHTEGSGLGLSIARSLTELQNGTFRLTIDGDLFKAEVSLRQ